MSERGAVVTEELLLAQLERTLDATDFPTLGRRTVGKVRDCYSKDGRRVLIATDRLSAFDVVLGTVPFKGQVLNQMAAGWFADTAHLAPNHVLAVPDPNVTVAVECVPLRAELIMRAYLTGVTDTSIWTAYARGDRVFCGHRLPEGLRQHEALPRPILTPSTKAGPGAHDRSVSRAELLESGAVTADDFDAAAALTATLFAFGQRRAAERGLILADTKYERGRAPDGRLLVIDEIHTPDSSRYWHADDYAARLARGEPPRALDKEFVRRWLSEHGYRGDGPPPPLPAAVRVEAARRYVAVYEQLMGRPFVPDTRDLRARLAGTLGTGAPAEGG